MEQLKFLFLNDLQLTTHGNELLPIEPLNLSTPYEYFKYFYTDTFFIELLLNEIYMRKKLS